jgi:hypothetical protein
MYQRSWGIVPMGLPRSSLLIPLIVVLTIASISMVAKSGKLIESDDFTGHDGDLPDPFMWESVKTTADDSVRLEANSVRAAVKNGGYSFVRSNQTFSTNNVTLLVEAKIGYNFARPIDVRILTNHSGKWHRWLAVGYDPHGYGWSMNRYINGEPDGFNTYETTGSGDVWYLINITVTGAKVDMTVTERDSGKMMFSIENWTCDPLESENKVYFGVFQNPPGSWQDTICFYDNYRLYDLSREANRPPRWGPLPVLEAVEDEVLFYDFSANVSDPDDPLTRLSLSSGSPYVTSISGFNVSFLFPNGVTRANITLVLSDGLREAVAIIKVVVVPVNDPPTHLIPEELDAIEDVPLTVDLSSYMSDVDNETYELFLKLDSPFVTASGLSITALFPDGILEYDLYLFVTDGIEDVEATIHFTIKPVDDPPVVDDLGEFTATEGRISVFNMTPYLHDVDTPVERLGVFVDMPECTVDGQHLCFLFDEGSIDVRVNITVYDDHNTVTAWLSVHVKEVNDPPIIGHVPTERVLVNVSKELNLSTYITDEDTPLFVLSLTCDHEAVCDISGLTLTLLYTRWEPEHDIEFTVFDGTSSVNGSFGVQVTEVNLPPTIKAFGGPIVVEEGTERWVRVRVSDEEVGLVSYSLETEWDSIAIMPNGTLHITAAHGDVGVRSAILTVTDPHGLFDAVNLTVEVVNVNDPPTIVLVSPVDGTKVRERNPVNFTVRAGDPDLPFGDRLTVVWSSSRTGRLRELAGEGELGFVTDGLAIGTHIITVTVSDGRLEANLTIEVTVEKEPPEQPYYRTAGFYWLIIAVIVLVMVMGTFYLWIRSKTRM